MFEKRFAFKIMAENSKEKDLKILYSQIEIKILEEISKLTQGFNEVIFVLTPSSIVPSREKTSL